jgi:hypothetical protein
MKHVIICFSLIASSFALFWVAFRFILGERYNVSGAIVCSAIGIFTASKGLGNGG